MTGVIYTVNGSDALNKRQTVTSRGTGMTHWSAEFFGPRDTTMGPDHPAALLPHALVTDMAAGETILPHFHGVAQFQIFSGGAGSMGRHQLRPLMVQFKDHHAAYGPVVAGPQGLTFFAMRMQALNSAPVYLDKPGYREKLKPSRRRNLVSPPLVLSTPPVLASRSTAAWEAVYPESYDDGLSAQLLRLGRGMTVMSPSPQRSGGLYLFVVNGSLEYAQTQWPLWSMLALDHTADAVAIGGGATGLELLVLEFPHETT